MPRCRRDHPESQASEPVGLIKRAATSHLVATHDIRHGSKADGDDRIGEILEGLVHGCFARYENRQGGMGLTSCCRRDRHLATSRAGRHTEPAAAVSASAWLDLFPRQAPQLARSPAWTGRRLPPALSAGRQSTAGRLFPGGQVNRFVALASTRAVKIQGGWIELLHSPDTLVESPMPFAGRSLSGSRAPHLRGSALRESDRQWCQ